MILTKKVLVSVLAIAIVLGISIVPCLASSGDEFVSLPAPILVPIDNVSSDVTLSFGLFSGTGSWHVGVLDSSGNPSSTGTVTRIYINNGMITATEGTVTYFVGDGANDCLFFVPSGSVLYTPVDPLILEYFVNVRTFPASSFVQVVPEFFSIGIGFASGIVDFILSSWITAIVLVLYVGIALFGIFRRLFKGA